jgi:dihydroorotate dehydrogenase electron transfer subunit
MSQYQENVTVSRIEELSPDNYRITLIAPQIAAAGKPGQFVMVRAGYGKDPLLRRPFSIHQVTSGGQLQLYFRVVGRGTKIIAQVKEGDRLNVFGPLGRGFRLVETAPAIIVGGGLGIAPLLFLTKENCRQKKNFDSDMIILGARTKAELSPLVMDFEQFGLPLLTATDDGSLGHHGVVSEVLARVEIAQDAVVYACGPEPMMAAVGRICKALGVRCQVSVESVMACGMGACLGCSRPAKNGTYTHVCLHGPVYNAEDLVWNI